MVKLETKALVGCRTGEVVVNVDCHGQASDVLSTVHEDIVEVAT